MPCHKHACTQRERKRDGHIGPPARTHAHTADAWERARRAHPEPGDRPRRALGGWVDVRDCRWRPRSAGRAYGSDHPNGTRGTDRLSHPPVYSRSYIHTYTHTHTHTEREKREEHGHTDARATTGTWRGSTSPRCRRCVPTPVWLGGSARVRACGWACTLLTLGGRASSRGSSA
jgi:hypothetical protein